jgi:ArsR family transcriptional regulator, arsenate/arsenite/antimonite-responsive transcriptional repressor
MSSFPLTRDRPFANLRMTTVSTVTDAAEQLARIAKALAHPVRVQIVQILRHRSCVCGDLVDELPLAQTTIWQHLRVLKEAGVIKGEIEGPTVCYSLDTRTLKRFGRLVAELQGSTTEA